MRRSVCEHVYAAESRGCAHAQQMNLRGGSARHHGVPVFAVVLVRMRVAAHRVAVVGGVGSGGGRRASSAVVATAHHARRPCTHTHALSPQPPANPTHRSLRKLFCAKFCVGSLRRSSAQTPKRSANSDAVSAGRRSASSLGPGFWPRASLPA